MSYQEAAEAIVREHGTKDERERLDAGVLPEQELDKIVADVLFAAILDIPIRRKAKDESVRRYAMSIGLASQQDAVHFRVLDDEEPELGKEEWERLQRIKRDMSGATIRLFEVEVECGRYRRRTKYASVVVQLAERHRRLDFVLNPSEHQRSQRQPEVVHRRRPEPVHSLAAPEEPVDYSRSITKKQLDGEQD